MNDSLKFIDYDDICVSNTNRQLHAIDGEYGKMKTQSLKQRFVKINPEIEIQHIGGASSRTGAQGTRWAIK